MDFKANGTRSAAVTTEQLICDHACIVYGIFPELTTTGTITLRDGKVADASGTIKHIAAIGLTQAGKMFGAQGVIFPTGLTIQTSVNTDLTLIVWEPYP